MTTVSALDAVQKWAEATSIPSDVASLVGNLLALKQAYDATPQIPEAIASAQKNVAAAANSLIVDLAKLNAADAGVLTLTAGLNSLEV